MEFIWSEKQQKAFDRLKVIMAKKPVVKIFDPKKDITLNKNASKHSVSGILSEEGHPIMYLSRRLTNTEFTYSNIEKETLVIDCTVGCGCRIHRLHLCRIVRPFLTNECPGYDTKKI